jgi:hypothetical protein
MALAGKTLEAWKLGWREMEGHRQHQRGVNRREPTHYRIVLNSKTAKAIGLTILQFILALADEVIE